MAETSSPPVSPASEGVESVLNNSTEAVLQELSISPVSSSTPSLPSVSQINLHLLQQQLQYQPSPGESPLMRRLGEYSAEARPHVATYFRIHDWLSGIEAEEQFEGGAGLLPSRPNSCQGPYLLNLAEIEPGGQEN
jgi:hypothetical protein